MGSNRNLKISATGFPMTNETLRFMQDAWRLPLESFSNLAGNKVILSGLNVVEGIASAGYVAYNGIVYPFLEGEVGENVTLKKNTVNVEYDVDLDNDDNLDSLPAYETYHLEFGNDGIESFPFADLFRLKSIKELSELENYQLPENVISYLRKGERLINLVLAGDFAALAEDISFPALPEGTTYTVIGSFECPQGGVFGVAWATTLKTLNQFNISGTVFNNLANTQLLFKWYLIKA